MTRQQDSAILHGSARPFIRESIRHHRRRLCSMIVARSRTVPLDLWIRGRITIPHAAEILSEDYAAAFRRDPLLTSAQRTRVPQRIILEGSGDFRRENRALFLFRAQARSIAPARSSVSRNGSSLPHGSRGSSGPTANGLG